MFTVHNPNVTVVIDPIADDRCNPNAPRQATYKQREYAIDLVYETDSPEKREAARRMLLRSATEAGLALIPFKEC